MVAPQNSVCTIELDAGRMPADGWRGVRLVVDFEDPDGRVRSVPAYWDGGSTWRARYSSPAAGTHAFRSRVEAPDETGLEDVRGEIAITRYEGPNPLLRHGAPAVGPDRRHLVHGDGTPFFWLADTWWSAFTARFRWPDVFQTLADDRAAKGFTVVQLVAGLVPECVPFTEPMGSEGGQPLLDGGRGPVNPAYYAVPDLKIDYLVANGVVPCIVGGWGYFARLIGREQVLEHWRHLVARYAAYPVVWCIAGEVDLPAETLPLEVAMDAEPAEAQVEIWEGASALVRELDPFDRVRTVHPSPPFGYASSEAFSDRGAFDLDMLQTGHFGRQSVPDTMVHLHTALGHGNKPVLNGECSYEGIFDSCWHDVQRFLFWSHLLQGAAGHTYGTMAIATLNDREDPRPPMTGCDSHFWQEAIDWRGATQVGLGRHILESLSWWELEPCPDLVEPHAGSGDWFAPYAARTRDGTFVVYVPSVGMMEGNTWDGVERLVLSGAGDRAYELTFVDPRSGEERPSTAARPAGGCLVLEPVANPWWMTPTGEDWVLIARPARG